MSWKLFKIFCEKFPCQTFKPNKYIIFYNYLQVPVSRNIKARLDLQRFSVTTESMSARKPRFLLKMTFMPLYRR